ncbi:MAG: FAD-binding oxidoreductase [Deltaproteobacteria bacterium]|nr:FAD-binding oxidoreductase [Deltaproteobacteria bacterium]
MNHSESVLSGWGRIGVLGHERRSENLREASRDAVLSRGLGRSYGDSALPPPSAREVLGTALADRLLGFDEGTGILHAEAGVSIEQLNRRMLPMGYFVPVTPGTQFVTMGGAVAADVHGKNHHVAGCFGEHVTRMTMRVASGEIVSVSPNENADLFWATVGGMGLTGHILDVEFAMKRVPSPWIYQESWRVPDIDAYIDALAEGAKKFDYTVGWIDCLSRGKNMGRGILMAGDWAKPEQAPSRYPSPLPKLSMPFELPSFALNPLSIKAFNFGFYWKHLAQHQQGLVHWQTFFYPLDMIRGWNKMYGPRGFTQYQCVLPAGDQRRSARRVLDVLSREGGASFLCVIKDCGEQGQGILSFPMKGISIALDIPVNDRTQKLIDTLNEVVLEENGRIYLAKDQFTRPEHFAAMEPRLEKFRQVRDRWDPTHKIRSAQSVRLLGDRP